jgi:general secretion pathway protein D
MRKTFLLVVAAFALCTGLHAQIVEEDEELVLQGVTRDISIAEWIQLTSEYQKIKFLYNPQQVSGAVTIVAPREGFVVPRGAMFSVLQTFLKQFRFILSPFGEDSEDSVRFFEIVPAADAITQADRVIFLDQLDDWTDTSADFVTLVVNLKYAEANNVTGALRNLTTRQGGQVQPIQGINSLIIGDYSYNIRRLAQIIQLMDQPPRSPRLEVININWIDAEELVNSLNSLLTARQQLLQATPRRPGSPEDETMVRVEVAPYVNAVMVTGFDVGIELVRELVARLDQEIPGAVTTGRMHHYQVKNVDAGDLASILNELLGVGLPSQQPGIPGQPFTGVDDPNAPVIVTDSGSNSLVIIATPNDYNEIRKIIDKLDVRRPQVVIEGAILEVSDNDDFQFGVELATVDGFGGNRPRAQFGTSFGFSEIVDSSGVPIGVGGGVPAGRAPLFGSGGLLTITKGSAFDIPLLVRFLKTQADTNVLQQPMLIVNDNEEGSIEIGTEIPRIEVTDTAGGASRSGVTQFDEAGINMTVTPRISPDGYITLRIDLDVTNFLGDSPQPGVPPPRQRRRITSYVTVPDATTVVIGGLKTSESSKSVSKIPLLGDIPLLGEFFKSQRAVERRTNLYIFLRPRILKDANFADMREESRQRLQQAARDSQRMSTPQKDEFFERSARDLEYTRTPAPGTPERAFDYQGLDQRD